VCRACIIFFPSRTDGLAGSFRRKNKQKNPLFDSTARSLYALFFHSDTITDCDRVYAKYPLRFSTREFSIRSKYTDTESFRFVSSFLTTRRFSSETIISLGNRPTKKWKFFINNGKV